MQQTIKLVCDMLIDHLAKFYAAEVDDDDCGSDDCVSVNMACVKFSMEQIHLACSSSYRR